MERRCKAYSFATTVIVSATCNGAFNSMNQMFNSLQIIFYSELSSIFQVQGAMEYLVDERNVFSVSRGACLALFEFTLDFCDLFPVYHRTGFPAPYAPLNKHQASMIDMHHKATPCETQYAEAGYDTCQGEQREDNQ